jgi:pilus assembly protein CpaB
MNTRAFTLALLIAAFAMFMVHTYVEDQTSALIKRYGSMSSVVVAKQDIKEFELIDDSKVTVISVPQKFMQPGAFKSMKEVENTIASVPILKSEQITKPRVQYPGANTGLSREVSVGKRALAISIDEQQSVSKLIKPGDRVDVLAPIDYTGGRKDMQKIVTILQDVRVLSTGMNISNNLPLVRIKTPDSVKRMKLNTFTSYNTVTLELDLFQVQKVAHLLTFSAYKPYLVLRNINDKEAVRIEGTRLYDILGENDQAEAKRFFAEKYDKK